MSVSRSCAAQNAEARANLWGSFFKPTTRTEPSYVKKKKCKDILGKETNRQLAMAPSENNVQGAGRVLTRHQS